MEPSCPCRVCVQLAKLNIPEWLVEPATESELIAETKFECGNVSFSSQVAHSLSSKDSSRTSPTLSESCDSSSSSSSVPEQEMTVELKSSLSSTCRSFRLSMDGTITEQVAASPISAQNRPLRRVASSNAFDSTSDFMDDDTRPKSLSRISSLPPRTRLPERPRMQRRCSVTKFSLENSFKQVQTEDRNEEGSQLDAPEVPRRPRMQRRCSVTKFCLDDTLHQVQEEDEEEKQTAIPPPPPLSPEMLLVKSELSQGLVATPESKDRFKARLLWGRAA